ncbi:hypothetical protein C2E23DRAFT_857076 [Lenzites betulinus]|nr:hypothetical protein C2E23DRAFT_857076 [Lenzites betulinus]
MFRLGLTGFGSLVVSSLCRHAWLRDICTLLPKRSFRGRCASIASKSVLVLTVLAALGANVIASGYKAPSSYSGAIAPCPAASITTTVLRPTSTFTYTKTTTVIATPERKRDDYAPRDVVVVRAVETPTTTIAVTRTSTSTDYTTRTVTSTATSTSTEKTTLTATTTARATLSCTDTSTTTSSITRTVTATTTGTRTATVTSYTTDTDTATATATTTVGLFTVDRNQARATGAL